MSIISRTRNDQAPTVSSTQVRSARKTKTISIYVSAEENADTDEQAISEVHDAIQQLSKGKHFVLKEQSIQRIYSDGRHQYTCSIKGWIRVSVELGEELPDV